MHELDAGSLLSVGIFTIIGIVIQILFLISMYKTMNDVEERYHRFPIWFIWLMLIPLVGYIFAWLMEPFGLPRSLEAAAGNNEPMKAAAGGLFNLGLAHMILLTLSLMPVIVVFTLPASLIIWFVYWYKVIKFRKTFLTAAPPKINQIKDSS